MCVCVCVHRCTDAEDFHILKIRLETDIQNLEQHLEAMRATYQLNTEKLEYNYRVLVERDHENQVRTLSMRRSAKHCVGTRMVHQCASALLCKRMSCTLNSRRPPSTSRSVRSASSGTSCPASRRGTLKPTSVSWRRT